MEDEDICEVCSKRITKRNYIHTHKIGDNIYFQHRLDLSWRTILKGLFFIIVLLVIAFAPYTNIW